ncbi:MAG: patatin-like phospholipase family protein [Bacillota bacterium]
MKNKVYTLLLILLIVLTYNTHSTALNHIENNQATLVEVIENDESYLIEDYARFKSLGDKTVGLSLSGGGAAGIFNIGVIKALVEEDIPVDFMVGSSMGSVVATMYGSGLKIEQVEDIVIRIPFSQMFDFNISSRESMLKTARFNKFIESIGTEESLQDFSIPTALLSIDLNSGKKYLITTGKISEVMQGSYAIPLYFPIHSNNGRYFADPGVVENSPAKAAKVLGADFIITTTLGGEIENKDEKYNTPTKAVRRYIDVVQNMTSQKVIEDYADIIIKPDLSEYGFMDFNYAEELVEIGYKKTKEMIPEIKKQLERENIELKKSPERELLDLKDEYRDLKYDRFLINNIDLTPSIYYGKDYSFFSDNLTEINSSNIIYGAEFNKNHLNLNLLRSNSNDEFYSQIRWRKLTKELDLLSKYRITDEYNDYQIEINYAQQDYLIGSGLGKVKHQDYLFFKGDYEFELFDYLIDSKSNIIYNMTEENFGILTFLKTSSNLTKTWDVEAGLVFNNTDLIKSPIIFRGSELNKQENLQVSLDYIYNHKFINNISLMNIFEIRNIGLYLFTDYRKDECNNNYREDLAVGLGSKSNFYLLGIKPIDLEIFYTFEEGKDKNNFGIRFNYDF